MAEATASLPEPVSIDALLSRRHSCRGFLPDAVPASTIERILATAQKTPSWCNAQPWRLVVTAGDATDRFREAIAASVATCRSASDIPFPTQYVGAALTRRRECGFALYESVGIAKGDRTAADRQANENFRLFGAPHVAIICTDATLGPYSLVDCGAYVMSFLLAATSLGIATVPQAALALHSGAIRKHFALGTTVQVVCGIAFGFEDEAHPANSFRTSRASLDEVVTILD